MSKQSEFAVILGLNPLFANLGAEALDRIAALCHTQHLAAREVLFQKGDSGDALYGIRRGQVRIETGTAARGMIAARHVWRNTSTTIATRTMASRSDLNTS